MEKLTDGDINCAGRRLSPTTHPRSHRDSRNQPRASSPETGRGWSSAPRAVNDYVGQSKRRVSATNALAAMSPVQLPHKASDQISKARGAAVHSPAPAAARSAQHSPVMTPSLRGENGHDLPTPYALPGVALPIISLITGFTSLCSSSHGKRPREPPPARRYPATDRYS